MRKYDILLFDMDGTIANTDDVIADAFLLLYDELGVTKRKTKQELYNYSGPSIRITLPIEFPGYDVHFLLDRYRKIQATLYESRLKIYEDEIDVLKKLKNAGYKLGIVTNKIRSSSDLTLDMLGISNLFDLMVCLDEIDHPKPYADGVEKILSMFNYNDKSRVIYIGDNDIDYYTAANSKIDSMIVTWGPREVNSALPVNYFVSSYKEIERIFLYE